VSAELTAQKPSAKYLVDLHQPLVRHFDLIAQAPGGVARLRELILTLAVQGKLVPQDPSDEPASELLKKIRAEKDRLIAEGKIKRDTPQAEITDEEKQFELPEGWVWVRNSNLFSLRKGKVPKDISDKPEGFPYLDIDALDRNIVKRYSTDASAPMCTCEDILVVCDGSRSGLVLQGQDGIIGSTLSVIDTAKKIQPFIQLIFQAGFNRYNSGMKGAAIPHLDTKVVLAEVVGLPPLDEQSRIVTRVEELMQLCDALEAQGQLQAEQHARLVSTLFGSLLQGDTPEALADNWQRIATHFDLLLDRPEAVDTLEQTILQLAVRGLLVPQDPTDEPASALLQKIRTEKDHLIAQGKIKRDKPLLPITDEEKPFELPQGWGWARLQQAYDVRDGTHDTPKYQATGYPLVTSKNIYGGVLDLSDVKLISAEDHEQISARSKVDRHDILFAMIGSIGNPVLVDTDHEFSVKNVALFKYYAAHLSCPAYLLLLLQTEAKGIRERAAGAVQSFVSLGQLRSAVVALPPLAEQSRIVSRVKELCAMCAHLRAKLLEQQSTASNLTEALIDVVCVRVELAAANSLNCKSRSYPVDRP